VLSSFNIDDFVNKGIDQEKLRSIVQKWHFTGFDKYL
jgi:hypothetical protein